MSGTPSDAVGAEMVQKTYTGHKTGSKGAVKIVLANSQQPVTDAETASILHTEPSGLADTKEESASPCKPTIVIQNEEAPTITWRANNSDEREDKIIPKVV